MAARLVKAHGDCVEHVKVDGYQKKVCILEGQDRREIIAFALEVREIGHDRYRKAWSARAN